MWRKIVTDRHPDTQTDMQHNDPAQYTVLGWVKIVKIVSHGYKVPLDKEPPPFVAKNNKSCLINMEFAVQELQRLEKLQCVKRVSKEDCRVIMPLSVVFSNKLCLVVDASRHINPYVPNIRSSWIFLTILLSW